MDLFGQIYILDLGKALGKFITHYRCEYFYQPGWQKYQWEILPGSFEKVIEKIDPLVLQLSANEWLEMPELIRLTVNIELDEKSRKAYDDVQDEFYTLLENDEVVAGNAAAAGVKCRQIANGAVYTGVEKKWALVHDQKLDALEDLLEELNGHPVLLLYEFNHDRERIVDRFPSAVDLRSGDVAGTIAAFNEGRIPLLIGHPASMGHGLNLQGACHHVIWFGITWNLEHYDQAIARVYRQGQDSKKVFVYHISAKDTLDERVVKVLEMKKKTQDDLLRALKNGKLQG
jgi:SNF2 family DNA or RNA helicase